MFERFNRDDKMLMAFAMQEAMDLGHRQLGNDHLILGMLCNARVPLFGLLTDQGLNLSAARAVVREFHREHADPQSAATDEESARQRYDEDRDALRSIGIDLDKLRATVRDRFGEDLSEGWAQRPGRGAGRRGRGDHGPGPGCGHPHHGPAGFGAGGPFGEGPWEPGRGRRGPRGRGQRPRFAPGTHGALHKAVAYARERGDRQLRPEYLLLGIIDTADDASQAVIECATTASELKDAVLANLPEVEAGV